MLILILKSSACLAILMIFYKLLLEKTSAHTFKRFYLIGIILISIGIPFITFTEYIEVEPRNFQLPAIPEYSAPLNLDRIEPTQSFQDYIPVILWTVYGIGVLLFAFRFFRNLIQLVQKIRLNPKIKNRSFITVLLQDLITPHTFFNYIFLNKTKFKNNLIPKEVLLHEETHSTQKHALDILFIETLQIVFWFNPLLYFIKKDIKLNHEFLADYAVIKAGTNTKNYQQLLLAFSSNTPYSSLTSPINYSLIKKRFTVMKAQTPKTILWIRSLIILPLLAILIYGFSQKITAEKTKYQDKGNTSFVQDESILKEGKGASEPLLKEYNSVIESYIDTNYINAYNSNRLMAIYSLMTFEQRRLANNRFSSFFNSYKFEMIPKHPTKAEFDKLKKSTKFMFYVDNKPIRTDELNNYSPEDILICSNWVAVNKNPSSGSYQTKTYRLLTKKGFEQSNQDYKARMYNKLFLNYSNEIKYFINSDRSNNSELIILKSQLDALYKELTIEDLNKFNIIKAKELPSKSFEKTDTKEKLPLHIIEYNLLAKKYNDQNTKDSNKFYYNSNGLRRLYDIYDTMSKQEKENAEPFPYFSNVILEHYGITRN